jgi:hypothetical protein
MEGHERGGSTAVGRRSQEGEGEPQEALPSVPLLAVIDRDGVDAEGKEVPISEDQGEHGRFAGLGGYVSFWESGSVAFAATGTAGTAAI